MNDRDLTAPGEATNDLVAPERLAALLDGRLSEQEREEILKQLVESPGNVSLLASAASALREVEGERRAQPNTPARVEEPVPTTWGWRSNRVLIGAAATILIVAGGAWFAARRTNDGALGPARFVAMLDQPATRLPSNWNGQPWTATRSGQDVAVSSRGRGVQLGARLVDLQIAVATADSTMPAIATDVARLVAGLPASGPISERFLQIGGRAGQSAASLRRELDAATNAARIAAGEQAVDLGSWLEAARLAAARRDAGYFQRAASRDVLDGLTRDADWAPETRTAAERVRATAEAQSPSWNQLSDDLTRLLAIAARGP